MLVFGTSGQVATELRHTLPNGTFLGRDRADLGDPDACAAAIRTHAPTAVINAAAYTAVDRAEEEESQALVINGEAPGAMARACADLGIPFVHISTDYVFDGRGDAPWRPDDPVARDIAAACLTIAQGLRGGAPSGIHHFAGAPTVSWAEFARAIFQMAGRRVSITDIPTADYPTPAARPGNSRLDGASLRRDFGIAPPDWRAGLAGVLKELS